MKNWIYKTNAVLMFIPNVILHKETPVASKMICSISSLWPLQKDIHLSGCPTADLPPTKIPRRNTIIMNSSTRNWFTICFCRMDFIAGLFRQIILYEAMKNEPRMIFMPQHAEMNKAIQQKVIPNISDIEVLVTTDKMWTGVISKFSTNWHDWKVTRSTIYMVFSWDHECVVFYFKWNEKKTPIVKSLVKIL